MAKSEEYIPEKNFSLEGEEEAYTENNKTEPSTGNLDTPFDDVADDAEGSFTFTSTGDISVNAAVDTRGKQSLLSSLRNKRSSLGILLSQNSKKEQATVYLVSAITYLVTFYIMSFILVKIQYSRLPYKVDVDIGPLSLLYELMSSSMFNLILAFCIAIFLAYFVIIFYARRTSLIYDGGVVRSRNGTYGHSDWINNDKKNLEETFEIISDISKPANFPIGIYNGEVYCMPDSPKHNQFKNQNVCILGGSGSGKSFGAIEPAMLQRIAYGESFLVTDTKGDLCRNHYNTCKKFGYNVKVFNTIDFLNSDAWNCLKDLVNAPPSLISKYVDIYADTIIKNTIDEGAKADPFWETNQKDFLKSCLHLVTKGSAFEGRRTFADLMHLITSVSTENIMAMLGAENPNGSAFRASASLRNTKSDDMKDRFRSGLANRLQVFNAPDVAAVLSYDEIDFEQAVKEKTAIFLITSDTYDTFDAITSLFVTCLYIKLIEISDSKHYGGKLKKPFWLIIDELCNMAAIRDLSRKISTNRSRNINFVLAIQSLSQLNVKYEKLAGNILANCGTTLFFGCNDPMTSKYVSERAGTFTQIVKSKTEDRPTIASKLYIPLQRKERVEERPKNLVEISDADQMPSGRVIAFISGKPPFKAESYGAPNHALYKYKEPISLSDRNPGWLQDFKEANPGIELETEAMYKPSDHELENKKPTYSLEDLEKQQRREERAQAFRDGFNQVKTNLQLSKEARADTADLGPKREVSQEPIIPPEEYNHFDREVPDEDGETKERKAEKSNDYKRLLSAARGVESIPMTAAAPAKEAPPPKQTAKSAPSVKEEPIEEKSDMDIIEEYILNSPQESPAESEGYEASVEQEQRTTSGFTGNLGPGFTGSLEMGFDDTFGDIL